MHKSSQFNLRQAAAQAGISEGLLHLWVGVGKITPSIDMSVTPDVADAVQDSVGRKALKSFLGDESSTRWIFTSDDVERLRKLVEQTAEKKAKTESAHVKGQHFSVQELAHLWGLGVDKIRELFKDEPGVIKIQRPLKRGRRVYTTLRIPENVAERVQRRLS